MGGIHKLGLFIGKDDLDTIFGVIDKDHDGNVDLQELVSFMQDGLNPSKLKGRLRHKKVKVEKPLGRTKKGKWLEIQLEKERDALNESLKGVGGPYIDGIPH